MFVDIGQVMVGLDFDRALQRIQSYSRLPREEIRRRMQEYPRLTEYEAGRLSSTDFRQEISRLLELRASAEDFGELWSSLFVPNTEGEGRVISEELFRSLQEHYRLIALSNTNELHFRYLSQHYPLINEFDDYVLSFRVGSVKPEAAIFRAALRCAGRPPERVFFIDDRPENVEAAQRLGIAGVIFENEEQLKLRLRQEKLLK